MRSSNAPAQPTNSRYSGFGFDSTVGTSSPSAHSMRFSAAMPHGFEFFSRFWKVRASSAGMRDSVSTRCVRICRIFSG